MSRSLNLAALFCAVALSACGGGGDATPAPVAAPAPAPAPLASAATSAANCPAAGQTFTLSGSALSGANTTLNGETIKLSFTTPLTSITVKTCVIQRVAAGFPQTPAALALVMTALPVAAILADGQFDLLNNKQLAVSHIFFDTPADQVASKKLVAYTQTSTGAWVRTVLPTTQGAGTIPAPVNAISVVLSAPVTAGGFYTVE